MIGVKIRREFVLYLLFGLIQLAIDTTLLLLFVTKLDIKAGIANFLSRFCAAGFGFFLNHVHNFNNESGKARETSRAAWRFFAWWVLTTLTGSYLLELASNKVVGTFELGLVKVAIEGGLVIATFMALKWFVFR